MRGAPHLQRASAPGSVQARVQYLQTRCRRDLRAMTARGGEQPTNGLELFRFRRRVPRKDPLLVSSLRLITRAVSVIDLLGEAPIGAHMRDGTLRFLSDTQPNPSYRHRQDSVLSACHSGSPRRATWRN